MQAQSYTQNHPMKIAQLNGTEFPLSPSRVLYDVTGLGKLAKDASFVRKMQQLFIERIPGQMAQIQTLIEQEDWLSIVQLAHSLKASFGNLRIEPGTTLLKELECLAFQQRDKLELLATLRMVATDADAVVQIFRQELSLAA
jgi:HPt (histidine-containing phosphotransfer) domain-containing protein